MYGMITFGRIIKTGVVNLIRNSWLAIAALSMMLVTLTIILFLIISNATFVNTINELNEKIDVSVYLKDSVTDEQRTKLTTELQGIANVKSVDYIDKDEALERYRKDNSEDVSLLTAVSQIDNPLPASLLIKMHDVNEIDSIRAFLETDEHKQLQSAPISYSGETKEAIDKISKSTLVLRQVAAVGVLIFTLVSVLIIFNTIQMAIFNRRDEITIMRLLGASTAYIRGPFVVETIIYGILAGVTSVIICGSLFTVASSTFEATSLGLLDISFASEYFATHFWKVLSFQLAIGIIIGAASSTIATRRYLKFKPAK